MNPKRNDIGATPFQAAAELNAHSGLHAVIRITGRVDAGRSSTRQWTAAGRTVSAAAHIDAGEPAPQVARHAPL
jgi:hypothetical protein